MQKVQCSRGLHQKTRSTRTNTNKQQHFKPCTVYVYLYTCTAHVPCRPMIYNNNYTLVSHFFVLCFSAWNVRTFFLYTLLLFYRILIIFAEKSSWKCCSRQFNLCTLYRIRGEECGFWAFNENDRHRWNENDSLHRFGHSKIHLI